ncbi:MAG: carboxypeptidase-like regulatory domain-containing protein, partial [Bacteroidaceae bacterium]
MKLIKSFTITRYRSLPRLLAMLCLFCSFSSLFAQNITVTGVITDANGESIIGANVTVLGTSKGVISDFNGKFSIEAPAKGTLKISYVGYHPQNVAIKSRTYLKVEMIEDAKVLDEVVVVGYGTVKKSDLTGSVSVIKTDDIKDIPATRIDQMLQGRIAGAEIVSTSGAPGAATSI